MAQPGSGPGAAEPAGVEDGAFSESGEGLPKVGSFRTGVGPAERRRAASSRCAMSVSSASLAGGAGRAWAETVGSGTALGATVNGGAARAGVSGLWGCEEDGLAA